MNAANTNKTDKTASGDTVSENWDRLTERLEQLRNDLSDVNSAAADLARAGASEGRDKLAAELDEITRNARSLAEELDARGHEAGRQAAAKASAIGSEIESTINRHPLTAVLVAAGLGVLLGMASRRRS